MTESPWLTAARTRRHGEFQAPPIHLLGSIQIGQQCAVAAPYVQDTALGRHQVRHLL